MEKSCINILTELEEQTLKAFFSHPDLKEHFYLTGGTALAAFYLGHRYSEDLDLFTHTLPLDVAGPFFEDAMKDAGLAAVKERSSSTFRRYYVEGSLMVDLVHDIPFRVEAPQLKGSFMVDSLLNIAVNKVTAVYGRLDVKDYVDLFFLKQPLNYNILNLIKLAEGKDGGMHPFHWARIIVDVETFDYLPRMIAPLTLDELKKFFFGLRDEILISLKPE